MTTFREFVSHLLGFTGVRALFVLVSMIAVALSEGLGLLLLVPLLALVGVGSDTAAAGFVAAISEQSARLGIELSLGNVIIVFLALFFVRQAMVYVAKRRVEDTRIAYVSAIREELFAAIGRAQWRFLRGGQYANVGQILLMDAWRAGDAAASLFRSISTGVILAVNAAVALLISPTLAVFALLGITTLVLAFGRRFDAARARGGRVTAVQDEMYEVVENYLENLRVAKLSAAENDLKNRFSRTLDDLGREISGFMQSTLAVGGLLQVAAATGIAAFILVAVGVFGVTGPVLLVVVFITARLVPHFAALNQSLHYFTYHLPAFANTMATLDACRMHEEEAPAASGLDAPASTIALDRVWVYAADAPTQALLCDVSLTLRVGETVALIGPSGAGKSTLADVLAGLIEPDRGTLALDESVLTRDRLVSWRNRVGYVPQSAALLRSSVRENLTWLSPTPPAADELTRLLACAGLTAVIRSLPDGLDTRIDRREGRLSGGERQRIALARELLRYPALLILDEATNALDLETEAEVLANVRRYFPSMTILIIAHRPETQAFADRTLRIREGRLIDGGPFVTGDSAGVAAVAPVSGPQHA